MKTKEIMTTRVVTVTADTLILVIAACCGEPRLRAGADMAPDRDRRALTGARAA